MFLFWKDAKRLVQRNNKPFIYIIDNLRVSVLCFDFHPPSPHKHPPTVTAKLKLRSRESRHDGTLNQSLHTIVTVLKTRLSWTSFVASDTVFEFKEVRAAGVHCAACWAVCAAIYGACCGCRSKKLSLFFFCRVRVAVGFGTCPGIQTAFKRDRPDGAPWMDSEDGSRLESVGARRVQGLLPDSQAALGLENGAPNVHRTVWKDGGWRRPKVLHVAKARAAVDLSLVREGTLPHTSDAFHGVLLRIEFPWCLATN